MITKPAIVPAMLLGLLIDATTYAADHSAVMPFIVDDVAAIAYLDLTGVDMPAILSEARSLGLVPRSQWDDAATDVFKAQRWIDQLVQNGATRAYALLRTSDLQHMGPAWVVPLEEGGSADAVIKMVVTNSQDSKQRADRPPFFPKVWQDADGTVLGAMNQLQMERLASLRAEEPRGEIAAALADLEDGDAGFVVFGDRDSRRVLREVFPRLPAPFAGIDGRMIADDLLWGGVVIDLPPEPKVVVHLETSSVKVAETVKQSVVEGLELAKLLMMEKLLDAPPQVPADGILRTLGLLKPTIDGAAVRLTLGDDAEELARVRDLLAPPIAAAQEAAGRKRRMNQFKQLALAFHNYASAHKAFPVQANYDDDGRPLLSWRVHLLPYLEQQSLYNDFHLDEPWDSPHNRQLIARMPKIYADPNSAVRLAVSAGRTTFLAPVADETVFPARKALPKGEPLSFRDVTDGTSKTILFVEVVPEWAVVWTKPDDWNVDLDHPLEGVKRTDRSGFVYVRCDGSAHYMPNDVDATKLRSLLTRAGREVVD